MKLAAAFVLGALSMWVLLALLEQDAQPLAPTAGSYGAPPPAVVAPATATQSQQAQAPSAAPSRDSQAGSDWPGNNEPSRDAQTRRAATAASAGTGPSQPADAPPPEPPAVDNQIPSVERLNNIPPLDTPIPVEMSPAHADVASRTETIAELHSALESEPEDVSWAFEMQSYIQSFLLQSAPMQNFGNASVHCRTALCEIQAIGYAPGSGGQTQWSVIMGQMRLQPWFRNFAKSHGYASSNDEQTVIFTFLERNPAMLEVSQ